MDGGLDALYLEFFGVELQARVQNEIEARHGGKLAVGSALLVPTGHARVPRLICAPTMENPGPVEPQNSYFAFSAALKIAARHRVERLFCPGLATGIGEVLPRDAAREMAAAYGRWVKTGPSP